MPYQLRLKLNAEKELDKIPKVYQRRILSVLNSISANPYLGKKLEGEHKGHYSFRV